MTDPIAAPLDTTPEVDAPPSNETLWTNRGHALIRENLARANSLRGQYPVIGILLPQIEAALRDLFSHMVLGPDGYAKRLAEEKRTADEAAADEEKRLAAAAPEAPVAIDPDYRIAEQRLVPRPAAALAPGPAAPSP